MGAIEKFPPVGFPLIQYRCQVNPIDSCPYNVIPLEENSLNCESIEFAKHPAVHPKPKKKKKRK